jgi:hypothetical protein
MENIVTGFSESRLFELRKYVVNGTLDKLYKLSNNILFDGLDLSLTLTGITSSTFTYYIGGIKYVDTILNDNITTRFEFPTLSINDSNNFDDLNIIKNDNEINIVEKPQINSDVFIVRQQQSVFEKNFRLKNINTLNEIISYAGGNYFTIFINS